MPPKQSVSDNVSVFMDTLISGLTNQKVIEAFALALTPAIQTAVQSVVDNLLADTHIKIDQKKAVIDVLDAENHELRLRVEQLEAYSRLYNIVIHGLPESCTEVGLVTSDSASTSGAGATNLFLKFWDQKFNIKLSASDIDTAHRLPKSNSSGPRPLLVRLCSRRIRTRILAAGKILRQDCSCKTFVNEHLTKHASQIFAETRKLYRNKELASTWAWNGRIHINTLDSRGAKIVVVSSFAAINQLI